MINPEEALCRECYGCGSWSAPYWFIGPEQGQGKHEGSKLERRYEAFKQTHREGLSDSYQFHQLIGENRWHREDMAFQPTWRRLILLLMAYQDRLSGDHLQDISMMRTVQRKELGMTDGKTCPPELSGVPANSFAIPRDRQRFRDERLGRIWRKLLDRTRGPEFVLIYGKGQWKYWKEIPELAKTHQPITMIGTTLIAFSPHPLARGITDDFWTNFGYALRRASLSKQAICE